MTTKLFRRVRHVHMVGIGGAGMSGIAEVLLNLGFEVTGSDLQLSEVTDRLMQLGARVTQGHDARNVQAADVVVFSSAVRPENIELRTAREKNIPTIPRSEMLAELMRLKKGIAVSGTHGKTTTTSMIGAVLQHAGLTPTLIVGGIVRALGSGANVGAGEWLVVEADEFDRTFLKLSPTLAVITTIEAEHLDTYTDLADIQDAFVEFANHVPFYGCTVVCGDETNIAAILPRIKRPLVTYGFAEHCHVRGADLVFEGSGSQFRVFKAGIPQLTFRLAVPGRHNVYNALAAIAVADELDIPWELTRDALAQFAGVRRRFEIKGEFGGIIVVDDYAHHPTEIENTLRTARTCWPQRRLVALFQPHLFTRTRDFAAEFGKTLALADVILLAEVYPARERPIAGVSAKLIADAARLAGARNVHLLGDADLTTQTRALLRPGDALIVMGAGSITYVAQQLAANGHERAGA